jgi:hypothetical protein
LIVGEGADVAGLTGLGIIVGIVTEKKSLSFIFFVPHFCHYLSAGASERDLNPRFQV